MTRTAPTPPVLALVLLALVCCGPALCASPIVTDGVIRVTDADLRATVSLDGDWDFAWGKLVGPGDTGASTKPAFTRVAVPAFWTDKAIGLPAVGCATYHLTVILPDTTIEPLGILLGQVSTAYRVYANGVLLAENGRVSAVPSEVRAQITPRTVYVSAAGRLDILIQVANTEDVTAGMAVTPILGYQSAVAPLQQRSTLVDALIYAAILVMGLYHILLAILRPAERASMFFGLLALDLALRGLLTGTRIVHQYLGFMGYHTLIGIEFATVYLAALFVYFYFYYLFPDERPRFARIPLIVITALLCPYVLVAPIRLITPVHIGYEVFLLLLGVLIIVWLIRAIISRREGAVLMLLGFLVMLGGTAYDIVQDVLDTGRPFIAAYAMLLFIFLQAVLIARRYAAAFSAVEEHSRKTEVLATSYGRFVPREFLSLLGKDSIVNVELGDQIETEMTVLFSDIRSFTALSENMGPRENFNFLNSYLKRVSPVIRSNRGFIDKYMGDGIMALFPRSAADALRAATEMLVMLREYNVHRSRSGYAPISVGVGVNTGRLMLGTVGEESRMEGTVISDVVNLASRLQGLTRSFGVNTIVSDAVIAACADCAGLPYRYLGRARVKGKARPVALYEVIEAEETGKIATRGAFESAVRDFESRRWDAAHRGFTSVLAEDPGDSAARYYLQRWGASSRPVPSSSAGQGSGMNL